MNKDIKVGDYVRILDVDNIEGGNECWNNGDIVKVIGESKISFYVETDKTSDNYYYITKETELDYIEKVDESYINYDSKLNNQQTQKVKIIQAFGKNYGEIGKEVGNGFHVGDVIAFATKGQIDLELGTVLYTEEYGEFIYGRAGSNLNFDYILKAVPYTSLTQEILDQSYSDYFQFELPSKFTESGTFKIVEVELPKPKEMTLEEIEKELGYKIKIVDNKEEE